MYVCINVMRAQNTGDSACLLKPQTPMPWPFGGVAKSRLGGTVTEDKLTSTSAVVIAIITVRAMLSIVACLELGVKTVS